MKKNFRKKLITWLLVILVIPAVAWICSKSPQSYFLISLLVLLLSLGVFFLRFEKRKPQARELVLIAVLCALAAAGRIVFQMVPFFKPLLGIAMIAGAALGAESGFLVGSVSILASNFLFGQGTWTPWQMFAYGFGAFLFTLCLSLFHLPKLPRNLKDSFMMALLGFLITVLITGPILDTSTFFFMSTLSTDSALAIYTAGFPVNLVHGAATFVTVLFFAKPLLEKLSRIQTKYGLMEG